MKENILRTRAVQASDGTPGVITYGLRYLGGNNDAYFTLTARFSGEDRDGHLNKFGGTCHDTILAIAPDLQIFADLHLSYSNGVPMHAFGNACSHAGVGEYSRYAPQYLASHLRVSVECAEALCERHDSAEISEFITSQHPRWAAQAAQAIKMLEVA